MLHFTARPPMCSPDGQRPPQSCDGVMSIDVPPPFVLPRATLAHTATVPLARFGMARCSSFAGLVDGRTDHLALCFGVVEGTPLVRLHSECLTGDVFGSLRCDCGPQLDEALERCSREGGIVLYLRQEGRGIGLAEKIAAYALQEQGLDTFEANRALGHADDARDYRIAAQMLEALGIRRIRLLSNNPDKQAQLEEAGIVVAAREATGFNLSPHNARYLEAKRVQAGHSFFAEALPPETSGR